MKRQTASEQYDNEEQAESGRRKRWAKGWVVRDRRRRPVRGPGPFLDAPPTDTLAGSLVLLGFSVMLALALWAIRRKAPKEVIDVTYQRADES